MKKIFVLVLVMLLASFFVFGHEGEDFSAAKSLIDSKVSCADLSDDQLETIGDYYTEQMHPGDQHEVMDKMMGGEDSDELEQAHIMMAKKIYCNENISSGMMGYGMMGNNMMGSGMMGNNMMGSGMMKTGSSKGFGSYGMMGDKSGYGGSWHYGSWIIVCILGFLLLLGLVILVWLLVIKMLKGSKGKK